MKRSEGLNTQETLKELEAGRKRMFEMWIDNYGLSINVETTYEKYSHKIGKPLSDFTEEDRRLAFQEYAIKTIQSSDGKAIDE